MKCEKQIRAKSDFGEKGKTKTIKVNKK